MECLTSSQVTERVPTQMSHVRSPACERGPLKVEPGTLGSAPAAQHERRSSPWRSGLRHEPAMGRHTLVEGQPTDPSEAMVLTAPSSPLNMKRTRRYAFSVPPLPVGRTVCESAGVGTVPDTLPAPVAEQVRASDAPEKGSRQKYQRQDLGRRHHDRRLLSPRCTNGTPRCPDWGPRHPLFGMCVRPRTAAMRVRWSRSTVLLQLVSGSSRRGARPGRGRRGTRRSQRADAREPVPRGRGPGTRQRRYRRR